MVGEWVCVCVSASWISSNFIVTHWSHVVFLFILYYIIACTQQRSPQCIVVFFLLLSLFLNTLLVVLHLVRILAQMKILMKQSAAEKERKKQKRLCTMHSTCTQYTVNVAKAQSGVDCIRCLSNINLLFPLSLSLASFDRLLYSANSLFFLL